MGLQGYSSPTPAAAIFAVHRHCYAWVHDYTQKWFPDVVIPVVGCYKGEVEDAFFAPVKVFEHMRHHNPSMLHGEESVLLLGTPHAMNHRPACLRYMDGRPDEDLGMFIEATPDEAREHDGWTHNPATGKYWVCVKNPADCIEEEKHRQLTQVLVDLMQALYVPTPANTLKAAQSGFDALQGRRTKNGDVLNATNTYKHIIR